MSQAGRRQITISVETGDVRLFRCDVLAMKFAQELYGADAAVARHLSLGPDVAGTFPDEGDFRLLANRGQAGAAAVLFVGVSPLSRFGYEEIRKFARRALAILSAETPQARSVAMTVHGPGAGLDEVEAFRAEIAGLVDAITAGEYPSDLASIVIVERDRGRADRLKEHLAQIVPGGGIDVNTTQYFQGLGSSATEDLRSAGYTSAGKPHVFVAMPFVKEMEDHYHYGIAPVVRDAGFLCERADQDHFVGDVLDRVKERIAGASMVVADLSTANPNVYLEVGYAWGCGKPTLLLVRDAQELKFDVRGQRCLVYQSIRSLEDQLRKELQGLKGNGTV